MNKKIRVIGSDEFSLGFRLAGITDILIINQEMSCQKAIKETLQQKEVGVVLIEETVLSQLEEYLREEVVSSVDPVFVTVSTKNEQEELRKMIIQSIGVDLLKE